MASTYVNDLRLEEIGSGEQSGTWGDTTNTNLGLIAEAFSYGTEAITTNANAHVTRVANGATDPGRSMFLKYTGTLDSNCEVTISAGASDTDFTISKMWFIQNGTTGGFDLVITSGSGADVTIPFGQTKVLYTDGAGSGGVVVDALANISIPSLFVKNTATGDDSTALLTLQTAEADIQANDVLGKINFQAPNEGTGTDAILVAAAIQAISEGDFSSSSNATSLEFMTGASEAAATKMTLTSGGNLNLKTDGVAIGLGADTDVTLTHVADVGVALKSLATADNKPVILTLQTGETDIAADDVLGKISFQAPDEGTGTDAILVAAAIQAISEGDFSSSSNATSLAFMTGASEAATTKMTLSSGGNLTVTGSLKNGSTHFNVDSSGDVILDSDTGNWRLKDAGTTIVELFHASDELYINSPVDGQNVRFNVNNGGSAIVPLKIHAEGYVVKETQPAFMAIKNADQDNIAINTATTILFQTEIYDVNANFASNTFTAPVTGKYLFAASLLLSQPAQDAEYIGIRLVSSNRAHRIGMYDFVGMDAEVEYWSIKGSVIVDMDASDTAFLQYYQSGGTAQTDIKQNDDTTVFTGYLLG